MQPGQQNSGSNVLKSNDALKSHDLSANRPNTAQLYQNDVPEKSRTQGKFFEAKLHSINSREFGNLSHITPNQEAASSKFLVVGNDVTNPITPTETARDGEGFGALPFGKSTSTLHN